MEFNFLNNFGKASPKQHSCQVSSRLTKQFGILVGLLVVLGFNATLTAKVTPWRSVTHMCFLAFSHQY